ncbi:MAG: hypothetical protein AAGC99_21655 [Pseudomonadota bacterium]
MNRIAELTEEHRFAVHDVGEGGRRGLVDVGVEAAEVTRRCLLVSEKSGDYLYCQEFSSPPDWREFLNGPS